MTEKHQHEEDLIQIKLSSEEEARTLRPTGNAGKVMKEKIEFSEFVNLLKDASDV